MSQNKSAPNSSAPVFVIGGGIVGLATAYALGREGLPVTLVDAGPVDRRATSSTAGIIGGSSVIPWASSTLWPRVPALLAERDSPLRLSFPLPPKLPGFLRKSVAAGREIQRQVSAAGLANLGLRGWDAWQELLRGLPEARDSFQQGGCLFLYATPEQKAGDAQNNALRRGFGMGLTDLSVEETLSCLPPLARPLAGSTRVDAAGHVSDPLALQELLQAAVLAQGGHILTQAVRRFVTTNDHITGVELGDASFHPTSKVVLCAGSGSAKLARSLGRDAPMIPAWGASVTFGQADVALNTPLLMLNDGIAITPSKAGLRVSGLLQIGGAGKAEKMNATLIKQAKHLFGDFTYQDLLKTTGPRPLSADSLPFLGVDPSYGNLVHNFGHGHWGLTQAAISAQVASDLVQGRDPRIEIDAYAPDRF